MTVALVQHGSFNIGSPFQDSIAITLTGTTAGNLFTIGINFYDPSAVVSTVTTDNGTTCSQATGAVKADGNDFATIWYGINNSNGSITITATFSVAGAASFPTIQVQEWSGAATVGVDVGIGNGGTYTSTTSVSISTNGTTTQADQLIYSTETPSSTAPTSVGGNQTLLDNLSSYQLIDNNASTITHTYGYAGSNNVVAVIAVFKTAAAADELMGAMVM